MLKHTLLSIILFLVAFKATSQAERLTIMSADSIDLKILVTSTKPVLLDFYATWCGPCKQMDRTVFSHPKVYTYLNRDVVFIKVNIDSGIGKELKRKYKVTAYPTYVLIKGGNEASRKAGKTSRGNFLNWVASYE